MRLLLLLPLACLLIPAGGTAAQLSDETRPPPAVVLGTMAIGPVQTSLLVPVLFSGWEWTRRTAMHETVQIQVRGGQVGGAQVAGLSIRGRVFPTTARVQGDVLPFFAMGGGVLGIRSDAGAVHTVCEPGRRCPGPDARWRGAPYVAVGGGLDLVLGAAGGAFRVEGAFPALLGRGIDPRLLAEVAASIRVPIGERGAASDRR